MIGEIIAIGDELTSGRIVNTTSGFAARHLFAAGYEIYAMHTIGDSPELIGEALKRAIRRVDFVIVTGGLGSTSDDLTNEAVADALNRPAVLYPEVLERIRRHLGGGPDGKQPSGLEKMAWMPEGAEVLNTRARMAGYVLVHDEVPIFFLPGVPSQMKELLVEQVLPRLDALNRSGRTHVRQRLYRTIGLPEIEINHRLAELEQEEGIHIGYYPVDSEVHVSLNILDRDPATAEEKFRRADEIIREKLGEALYGLDRESLAGVVGELLRSRGRTLSVAESCTGGLIGEKLTSEPGSSEWFAGGVIAYSNFLKETLLGVDRDLLDNYGAVSEQVARAMAARLSDRIGTDMTVAVTGIAGPGGGSEEKPVGTVYIGLFYKNRVQAYLHRFQGNRERIREQTAGTALDLARRVLLADGL